MLKRIRSSSITRANGCRLSIGLLSLLLSMGTSHASSNHVSSATSSAEDIARWGTQSIMDGSQARPLPLVGNWMVEAPRKLGHGISPKHWGPEYMMEMIKSGHHVLPTFIDTISVAKYVEYGKNPKSQLARIEEYKKRWKPILDYCRENKLPIGIRGWNWDDYSISLIKMRERSGEKIPFEEDTRLYINGKVNKRVTDPMGPEDQWTKCGEFWLGNPFAKWLIESYPNPPLVIMLNNNEAGAVHHWKELIGSDRYKKKYGKDIDKAAAIKLKKEGYTKLRKAMYDGARKKAASISPAWGKALRFVAYNNLWNTMEVGRKKLNLPKDHYPLPEPWDGGMLEIYDNDWQGGKTDFRPWSMQSEAMNTAGMLPEIYRQDPSFFYTNITWDGAKPSDIFRNRGLPKGTEGKVFYYITRGQRWDAQRFEGWTQFALWVQRPRMSFEFRGSTSRDAYYDLTWQAMVNISDRPWDHATLREFWEHGKLVPNKTEEPFWKLSEDDHDWLKKLDRWYLLTSSANPSRNTVEVVEEGGAAGQRLPDQILEDSGWQKYSKIDVWSMALVLGEAPNRKWLIYSHAPRGAVANSSVQLPDFGNVDLPYISRSGSFFQVHEKSRKVDVIDLGGPAEFGLSVTKDDLKPNDTVTVQAQVTLPASTPLSSYEWFVDGQSQGASKSLKDLSFTAKASGTYAVELVALSSDGKKVVSETFVQVGSPAPESLIYQLNCDYALQYKAPWDAAGKEAEQLLTWQWLNNQGTAPSAVMADAQITNDEERGQVVRLDSKTDGIYLINDRHTTKPKREAPQKSKTITFSFKADDVQKRQILFSEGNLGIGVNVYLLDGKLHAGSWASKAKKPWKGAFCESGELEANRWYTVELHMDTPDEAKVETQGLKLSIDGKVVAKADAYRLGKSFAAPRFGANMFNSKKVEQSHFHDGVVNAKSKKPSEAFVGYMDDIRYEVNK